ncbi:TIGR02444 family protein [Bowmanella pacifica]|uniref:TIGR02444 family protein n=1 Tax=Bowmanella pacifica TaxID=502051 RepID=A0A918DKY9_9ALTE|nr:TIGR02444 family protein [Bowmanella pacifica]GGO71731.1 hypothetical protein GCM10010982_28230 [Bowmanella pacifica]
MWQTEDFWQFSLALYQKRGALCLQLQDSYAMNVNLVLLCLYLQQHGMGISQASLPALINSLASTEQVITPLRAVRRQVKGLDGLAYQHLLDAELQLEKRQQADLIQCLNRLPVADLGEDNLVLYASVVQPQMPSELTALIAQLQTDAKVDRGQSELPQQRVK